MKFWHGLLSGIGLVTLWYLTHNEVKFYQDCIVFSTIGISTLMYFKMKELK